MENWFLSDKDKSSDVEWLVQNNEHFFDAAANLLKSKDEKTIGKVCMKLTSLYKEKDSKNQFLVINCIPILLNYYFVYFYDEKICSIIEVSILTIYNLSLSDENVKLNRIRIPNLSIASVYHMPQASPVQSELTESALSKLENEFVILEEQFKPYLDTINSEKRFNLIRFLMLLYNSRLNTISKQSKLYFCDMCLKICKVNRASLKHQSIYLNSQILIEMLNCLYYLFNNNLELDAYIAIESIADKADEEMMVDVILMCNSIKNMIQQSKSEPSIQNALSNAASSIQNRIARSGSIVSNRRKSNEKSSPVGNLNYRNSFLNAMQNNTNESGSPTLSASNIVSPNDVNYSPNKSPQKQDSFYVNKSPTISPKSPAISETVLKEEFTNIKIDHDNIPIIDDTSGENDDDENSLGSSNPSFIERL